MSAEHHGFDEERRELEKRFMEQSLGTGSRQFPHGRIGPDDDGDLTFAIASDTKHGVIKIQFAKPTAWIALDKETAAHLISELEQRLRELRGVSV